MAHQPANQNRFFGQFQFSGFRSDLTFSNPAAPGSLATGARAGNRAVLLHPASAGYVHGAHALMNALCVGSADTTGASQNALALPEAGQSAVDAAGRGAAHRRAGIVEFVYTVALHCADLNNNHTLVRSAVLRLVCDP